MKMLWIRSHTSRVRRPGDVLGQSGRSAWRDGAAKEPLLRRDCVQWDANNGGVILNGWLVSGGCCKAPRTKYGRQLGRRPGLAEVIFIWVRMVMTVFAAMIVMVVGVVFPVRGPMAGCTECFCRGRGVLIEAKVKRNEELLDKEAGQ